MPETIAKTQKYTKKIFGIFCWLVFSLEVTPALKAFPNDWRKAISKAARATGRQGHRSLGCACKCCYLSCTKTKNKKRIEMYTKTYAKSILQMIRKGVEAVASDFSFLGGRSRGSARQNPSVQGGSHFLTQSRPNPNHVPITFAGLIRDWTTAPGLALPIL